MKDTNLVDKCLREEYGELSDHERFIAILQAKPGSKLWDALSEQFGKSRLSKEEHEKMMSDPHWHR